MQIGTIGTGPIVETFLAACQQVPSVQVGAVYSRSGEKAAALASRFGIARTCTTMDELLGDPAIDTIYIALPNSLHFAQAVQALQANKHVILEKPMTSTLAEAQALVKLAREKGLYLFEAISTRHLPNYRQVRQDLSDIGPVRLVQCNYSQYSSRYTQLLAGEVTNIFNPVFSGGCLYDLNIYNLHFVIGLFGRPQAVHAYANKAFNGIDTSGTVVLEYDDFIATCSAAKDSASPSFQIIQGEKGYLDVAGPVNSCPSYEIRTGSRQETVNLQTQENRLVYEIEAFASCLARRDWAQAQSWLSESLVVMEVVEKARLEAGIVFGVDEV
ncbi:MAG: Gfo/Idh/MocA family oxidoreductase [Clostridia bacterium]|nr:Gfo/Idh/MocA family oxidoreductase [Clostridia bacterium]